MHIRTLALGRLVPGVEAAGLPAGGRLVAARNVRGVDLLRSVMKVLRLVMLLVALALLVSVTPSRAGAAAPVIAAAGDVACPYGLYAAGQPDRYLLDDDGVPSSDQACRQADTARLIETAGDYSAVLPLGDLVDPYPYVGTFRSSYASSWGAFKSITRPALGNHEYAGDEADGYFEYFNGLGNSHGRAGKYGEGWYSYRLGGWLLIALNSNCEYVGCAAGSEQFRWLRDRLRDNRSSLRAVERVKRARAQRRAARKAGRKKFNRPLPTMPADRGSRCVLAYWHHPRFSSGIHADEEDTGPFWRLMDRLGGDVVLNGHEHVYERFRPQNASGAVDPAGAVQFTVGTGGRSLFRFREPPHPGSRARVEGRFGILRLRLLPNAFRWNFVATDGQVLDAGQRRCTTT